MIEDTLVFKVLMWVLFASNLTSLVIDLTVVIGGLTAVQWFSDVPDDANVTYIRVFSAIEAIIVIFGIFGIIKKHFEVFTIHTTLLIIYFIIAIIFTRILISWFVLLAIILSVWTVGFLYLLYKRKNETSLVGAY